MAVAGIKRPAALLTGQVEIPSSLTDYEIMMVEPLHDLKNVINRIFNELPHAISDPALKSSLTDALTILKGKLKTIEFNVKIIKRDISWRYNWI